MATPYLQLKHDEVRSTQDLARSELDELPVLVLARSQSEGRGRFGARWETAPRGVAASLALRVSEGERRPMSLMAGVAAVRALDVVTLKWPNDIMVGEVKSGGILVERTGDIVVIGMGLNLWWPDAPNGFGAMHQADPGEEASAQTGALWGAELMRLLDEPDWPIEEYRRHCQSLGRAITWEPDGSGKAIDVDEGGGLIVEVDGDRTVVSSGAVRHVRG